MLVMHWTKFETHNTLTRIMQKQKYADVWLFWSALITGILIKNPILKSMNGELYIRITLKRKKQK